MQAVSVDEALLEVGSHFTQPDEHSQEERQEALAKQIRDEIRQATGCEASIGVASNILLARMSTKKAKPAGQFICKSIRDVEELLNNQEVTDLPGVSNKKFVRVCMVALTVVGWIGWLRYWR